MPSRSLTESHEVTGRLVADPRVGFFSFIGSARVGWMLRSRLAPGTRCALEHGGAAPVIVAADADLGQRGAGAGEGRVLPRRPGLRVGAAGLRARLHRRRIARRRLAERARTLKVGDPTLARDRGRAADPRRARSRVCTNGCRRRWRAGASSALRRTAAVRDLLPADGHPRAAGRLPPVDARRCSGRSSASTATTISMTPSPRANALPWAFQAAVFTRDYATAMRAYRGLDASAVMLNDHTAFRVDWMPFAGPAPVRASGSGASPTLSAICRSKSSSWGRCHDGCYGRGPVC